MVKILSYSFVILWMALIFFFSHQPASESRELSSGITESILSTIEQINPESALFEDSFHHIIRKSAHFFIYMVLGVLVIHTILLHRIASYKALGIAFLLCVLYAITDEVHQFFVPGRGAQLRDVLIDSAGASIGIVFYMSVASLATRRKLE